MFIYVKSHIFLLRENNKIISNAGTFLGDKKTFEMTFHSLERLDKG